MKARRTKHHLNLFSSLLEKRKKVQINFMLESEGVFRNKPYQRKYTGIAYSASPRRWEGELRSVLNI